MVSNNIHQIPCLENALLIEEWTEEKKVAKPKPAAATNTTAATSNTTAPAEEGKEPAKPEEQPQ